MLLTHNDPTPAVFITKRAAINAGLKVLAKWPDKVSSYAPRPKKSRGEIQGYLVMLSIKNGPLQPLTNGVFETLQ